MSTSHSVASQERPSTQGSLGRERRRSPRYELLQRCLVRPQGGSRTGDWHGIAYNISTSGIGFTLPYPQLPGELLEIEAWELARAPLLRVRVVRSAPVDFVWFCGCELLRPLKHAELRAWLAGKEDWLPALRAG